MPHHTDVSTSKMRENSLLTKHRSHGFIHDTLVVVLLTHSDHVLFAETNLKIKLIKIRQRLYGSSEIAAMNANVTVCNRVGAVKLRCELVVYVCVCAPSDRDNANIIESSENIALWFFSKRIICWIDCSSVIAHLRIILSRSICWICVLIISVTGNMMCDATWIERKSHAFHHVIGVWVCVCLPFCGSHGDF